MVWHIFMKKTLLIVVLFIATSIVGIFAFAYFVDCGQEADQLQASTDDSIFYSPEKPQGVSLPEEVTTFLISLSESFEAHDLDAVMEHFSEDFLHQGMSKAAFRDHLAKSYFVKHLNNMTVTLQKFDSHGDVVDIAGFIETDLGFLLQSSEVLPIAEKSKLRLENGRWRFFGNRESSPIGRFHDSLVIRASLAPRDLQLYRELLPKVFSMPRKPTVWIDITEHQRVSLPLSPYRLGRIQLLGVYKGEEGWYVLTLPETAWAPVSFGQTVGYPKYVVDSILFEQTQTGWRGQIKNETQNIMSLEFTPDSSVETWFERLTRSSCLTLARQLLAAYKYKTTFVIMPDIHQHGIANESPVVKATIEPFGIPAITETFGKVQISVNQDSPWAGLFPEKAVVKGAFRKFSGDWNIKHRILNDTQENP